MGLTAAEIDIAVHNPEVLAMMERLAQYGLGVCVPHMHTATDAMASLPEGTVQYEENLGVSFRREDDPAVLAAQPVSWFWANGPRVTGRCRQGHG
jgi:hypothetical protein